VLLLAERFLVGAGEEAGRTLSLSEGAREVLCGHSWPGNVRELEHACQGLAYLSPEDRIEAADVRDQLGI